MHVEKETGFQVNEFFNQKGCFFIIKFPHYRIKYFYHHSNIRISIKLALKWCIEQYTLLKFQDFINFLN